MTIEMSLHYEGVLVGESSIHDGLIFCWKGQRTNQRSLPLGIFPLFSLVVPPEGFWSSGVTSFVGLLTLYESIELVLESIFITCEKPDRKSVV